MIGIESLLSARLFMNPQRAGERLYFISNLSGRMSLFGMDFGGSIPEPLIPPDVSLQNPALLPGYPFYVLPGLGKILVMIDQDGDENYQPMFVSLDGGGLEPAFGDAFADHRVGLMDCFPEDNIAYLSAGSRSEPIREAYQARLDSGVLKKLGASPWGSFVGGVNAAHSKAVLIDGYTLGDNVLYLWEEGAQDRRLLFGKPLENREEGEKVPLTAIQDCYFTPGDRGILFYTGLFEDRFGLGYLLMDDPSEASPIALSGQVHTGGGELSGLSHLNGNRYLLTYNIDGSSWGYEGEFDEDGLQMRLDTLLWGRGTFDAGVLQSSYYDKQADGYALAFSTATSPAQLYTIDGVKRDQVVQHTRERILGIPQEWLSAGEEASFESFDGLRISARLYRPSRALGFEGARPLVYYLHGGPQSQERPDFTWFSMPLIQYLTMHGFAVFVPNARGSTGYGLSYTKRVDRDWGGHDRLDHVHAMKILADDPRIDTRRAGVVGRSYGGYMTLILAGRHPELWSAAVDMFGPYDLITFSERIPPTWKPYFKVALGDPEDAHERDFLVERSPKTHLNQLRCPLLVIQGANDPRVVERESRDLVEELREQGKEIEYLVFEDEGHDVLKFDNRVLCYRAITEFFKKHLQP